MNGRENCVHPVAKSFRDFLRLLLALRRRRGSHRAGVAVSAHARRILSRENPPTEEQEQALTILAQKFSLRAMAEPWKYIHTRADRHDYGKLRFRGILRAGRRTFCAGYAVKVTFEGTSGARTGKPGKEPKLGASFFAGRRRVARPGGVCREWNLDLCKRVPVEQVFGFPGEMEPSPKKTTAATGTSGAAPARAIKGKPVQ